MSQTRAQKRKKSKKKSKDKNRIKQKHMRNQAAPKRWRLDVFYEGRWNLGFKEFSKWEKVEEFREETEALRKKGAEIIAGRIVSLETGKVIEEIEASEIKADPKDLPDEESGAEKAKGLSEKEPLK